MATKQALAEIATTLSHESRSAYYHGYDRAEKEMIVVVIFYGFVGLIFGFIMGYGIGVR